jgi:spermidine synthase
VESTPSSLVKPFKRLGEATSPDGTVLSLFSHDGAYVIRVNGVELMSTRRHHSEDALATLACADLGATRGAQVLIGGLGLGFTLKAALAVLPADAHVLVVEIVQAVIDWNRDPAYPLAGEALHDPRVEVRHADVARVLREHPGTFDAIMLDVDNGADPLTTAGNAQLYRGPGIHMAAAALRPHGRLVYWSSDVNPKFENSLKHAGLIVTTSRVRAHATSGPWHTLYVAQREVGSGAGTPTG